MLTHWIRSIKSIRITQVRFMSNQRHFTLFCEILICLIHNLTSAGLLWTDEFNVAPSSRWRWHASFCSNIYASHELRGCFLVHMWTGWLHSCLSLSCITVMITIYDMCSLCRSDAEDERSKGKNEVSGEWDCSKWTDELLFISESCHHQILSFVNRDQIKKKNVSAAETWFNLSILRVDLKSKYFSTDCPGKFGFSWTQVQTLPTVPPQHIWPMAIEKCVFSSSAVCACK